MPKTAADTSDQPISRRICGPSRSWMPGTRRALIQANRPLDAK
jgi:hypothetical protein